MPLQQTTNKRRPRQQQMTTASTINDCSCNNKQLRHKEQLQQPTMPPQQPQQKPQQPTNDNGCNKRWPRQLPLPFCAAVCRHATAATATFVITATPG